MSAEGTGWESGEGVLYMDGEPIGTLKSTTFDFTTVEKNDSIPIEFSGSGSCKIEIEGINQLELFKILGFDIEELRKEYEGLGLSDLQLIQAKNLNLTPKGVEDLRKYFEQISIELNILFEKIAAAMRGFISSDAGRKLIELSKELEGAEELKGLNKFEIKRNKKGKPLKSWEKKSFYQ